jgi:hypothetical protein
MPPDDAGYGFDNMQAPMMNILNEGANRRHLQLLLRLS